MHFTVQRPFSQNEHVPNILMEFWQLLKWSLLCLARIPRRKFRFHVPTKENTKVMKLFILLNFGLGFFGYFFG